MQAGFGHCLAAIGWDYIADSSTSAVKSVNRADSVSQDDHLVQAKQVGDKKVFIAGYLTSGKTADVLATRIGLDEDWGGNWQHTMIVDIQRRVSDVSGLWAVPKSSCSISSGRQKSVGRNASHHNSPDRVIMTTTRQPCLTAIVTDQGAGPRMRWL
jgi:hypothetical protein